MSLSSRLSRISRPGLFLSHFHSHLHLNLQLQQRIASLGSSRLDRGRDALLRKVYAPFAGLAKGSPEYTALSALWHGLGRLTSNQEMAIDMATPTCSSHMLISLTISTTGKGPSRCRPARPSAALSPNVRIISVAIEDNKLHLGDSVTLNGHLNNSLPHLTSMTAAELSHAPLPDKLPYETPRTAGITEGKRRCLSSVLLKDTRSGDVYRHAWGKRVSLGDCRSAPIAAKSNPLRIFPYHDELKTFGLRKMTSQHDVSR
ncbi:hypothetical protein CCMA1212_001226 [Trichoderma ghanense]|uniref:Uncharacterized protein n=1 Tax=Trichoderma ghanense TaxID=65468 RepID=A0ABY2HH38_9HYPO